MYGHGGSSDAIAKDMNSVLHSSTFKHPSDGEFVKIKELISSNSYSNYNHHEHNDHSSSHNPNPNQNQNQMQNQNQHRPNIGGQTKASLTSYRSAPSSFFANLLDENDFFSPLDTTNNEPDDAFFSRQPQQQQTFQPSSKSMKLEAEKEGRIRLSSDMYGGDTQQVSHMQPTNNNGNYNHHSNHNGNIVIIMVVQPARKSVEDNNFSYARIGVLCKSRGRIVDRVDIRWREDTYKVWIDEDVGEWSPDCLKDFDARDEWKEDSVPGDDLEMGEIRGDVRLDNEPNTDTGTPFEVNAESSVNGFAVSKEGTPGFRKKYRRKNGIKNRGEASGSQERPKKRSRDDNDPFGLDRLIGIMATSTPHGTNEERESHGVFCTPDLNMGSELHLQNDQVVEQTAVEDLVHEAGIRIDRSPLDVEADETVALAKALGIENLQDFMPELHKILRSEGYQDVDK